MAESLAVYLVAAGDPRENDYVNAERVEMLRRDIGVEQLVLRSFGGRGTVDTGLRYRLAYELLAAGRPREAIAALDSLIRDSGLSPETMRPHDKRVYDLLGISWMRLAEEENCSPNPSAGVCILPLDREARHRREEGARSAIAVYEGILRRFPDDYGSRWLLNVAHMALGGYPRRVPEEHLVPGMDRRDAGPGAFPRFLNVAGNVGLTDRGLAGGVAIADFDRDGHLDLVKSSWGLLAPLILYRGDGRGGFVDRTAEAGLKDFVGGLNITYADYDNDGWQDLLVLRGAWLGNAGALPMSLLRNRGDGTFEDVTYAAGLGSRHPRQTAGWADINRDGLLDLFVGSENYPGEPGPSRPSELFFNNGDGTFTEVAQNAGIEVGGWVKGSAWGDVNNDGLPDLYISVLGGDNHLFVNRGGTSARDWRFENATARTGVKEPFRSFPTWFFDYDNDGWEDLFVASYDVGGGALNEAVAMEYLGLTPAIQRRDGKVHEVEQSRLYRNNGDGTFSDASEAAGLTGRAVFAMGVNFGDLDNDGWLDFHLGTGYPDYRGIVPNLMFRNVEGRRFEEVTIQGGFGHLQKGHGTGFVDFDRDGDQDVYAVIGGAYEGDVFTSVLFENPGWPGRAWVALELEGAARPGQPAGGANRSAIGARVRLTVADSAGVERTLYRTVGTGGSFGAGELQLHAGLDRATRIREIRVQWPDPARSTSTYRDVAVNRAYRIAQGGTPVALDRPVIPFRARQAGEHGHPR